MVTDADERSQTLWQASYDTMKYNSDASSCLTLGDIALIQHHEELSPTKQAHVAECPTCCLIFHALAQS